MVDSSIAVTPGAGALVDTRTESTNGHQRQVIVIGDPTSNDGIASVDASNGLAVDVKQSALPAGAASSANQDTQTAALQAIQAAQTSGGQKIQIVDAGGEVATITGGKLDVNASASLTGEALPISGATEAVGVAVVDSSGNQISDFSGTQYTEGDTDASIKGTAAMMEGAANTLLPIQGTVADGLLVNLGSNNDVNVNQVGGNSIATGSGNVSSGTQRVVLATDVALPAGSNSIGTLGANSGVDIGDVTINNASGASAVNIQDGGNTITVDGIVAATQSGTWNVTDVSGTVSLPTGASTLAEQQTQTTHLATIAGDTTNIETAVELIDDTVATLGTTTYTEATTKGLIVGAVRRDADTTLVGTTNEVSPLQVDANGRLKVEVFSGETLPVSGTVSITSNSAVNVAQMNGVATTMGNGVAGTGVQRVTIASDSTGNIATIGTSVTPGTAAANLGKAEDAAHANGDTGIAVLERRIDTAAPSATSSGDYATANQSAEGASWATLTPTTTSGCTIFRSLDVDETEEDVKTSAGNLYGYYFGNVATSLRYLKFYNATAANVTVGTTTPVMTFPLPPSSSGHIGFPYPISFATAITVACTTGAADADTGAPGANDVIINIFYK